MKKSALFAAILAAACTAPAMAQDENPYVFSLTAGAAFPTSSAYKEVYNGGPAALLSIAGPLSSSLSWRGDIGYYRFNTDQSLEDLCDLFDVDCDADMNGWHGTAGLEWHGSRESSFTPYVYAGAGVYHSGRAVFATGPEGGELEASESDTDFGLGFGLGFDYKFGESWGLRIEGRMNGVLRGDSSEDIWSIVPTGGLFFEF